MTKRRGISPVIATVIIVAVTIAVAIAVAFWMTGIVGLFTGFEQLEIVTIYDDEYGIHHIVKNTGTTDSSIVNIFINGYPYDPVLTNYVNIDPTLPIGLRPGEDKRINITFNADPDQFDVEPGASLEIKLHTAAGKDYPKLIVLKTYQVPPPQQQQGGQAQEQQQQGGQGGS